MGGTRLFFDWKTPVLRTFTPPAALVLAVTLVHAAAPVLDQLFPITLQTGSTNRVEAVGKFHPWPVQVWTDAPGIVIEATTNKGVLTVVVDAAAQPGFGFVRLFNPEGASAPHFLVLGRPPLLAEVEPNDQYSKPQHLAALPAVITGRLEKAGDVDNYAVRLEAGQTLVAAVEAHVLMSPIDSVLRLVDGQGRQLAWNHDDGRTLDPRLVWRAPVAGNYVVQVFGFDYPATSDVKFGGNPKCVYQLTLAAGRPLHHVLPLGVQRGAKIPLKLHESLDGAAAMEFEFDGTSLDGTAQTMDFQPPGFANTFRLAVGDGPEAVEPVPEIPGSSPMEIRVPGAVSAMISPAGDVDRFRFASRAGEVWSIAVQASTWGFPLDAWVRIEDVNGKELAQNDDQNSADPRLQWTAPAGTNFVAVVGGLGRQGGSACLYRLQFSHPQPTLKAVVADHAFTLEAGKTNEIKVMVTREFGFTNGLKLSLDPVPAGVTADAVAVSEKGGETVLRLIAATNVVEFSGPVGLGLLDATTGKSQPVVMELVAAGENNGVPQGYRRLVRESLDRFWLTVRQSVATPAPPEKK